MKKASTLVRERGGKEKKEKGRRDRVFSLRKGGREKKRKEKKKEGGEGEKGVPVVLQPEKGGGNGVKVRLTDHGARKGGRKEGEGR